MQNCMGELAGIKIFFDHAFAFLVGTYHPYEAGDCRIVLPPAVGIVGAWHHSSSMGIVGAFALVGVHLFGLGPKVRDAHHRHATTCMILGDEAGTGAFFGEAIDRNLGAHSFHSGGTVHVGDVVAIFIYDLKWLHYFPFTALRSTLSSFHRIVPGLHTTVLILPSEKIVS